MSKIEPWSARHTNDIGNDELPIQLKNDALGCPRCCVELTSRKSKVFVDGTTIGMFDSMACEFCGFFLLTEKGFDESAKVIKLFGLDIPKQDNTVVHLHDKGNMQDMKSYSSIISRREWQPLTSINPSDPLFDKHIDIDRIRRDEGDTRLSEIPLLTNPRPPTNNKQHHL